jgi:hypothetical protein
VRIQSRQMVPAFPRSPRGLRALLRFSAVVALVAFHAVLLRERMADASILEPVILAKYAFALVLLALATSYRRFVPASFHGRRLTLVFWLVVLLMHLVVPFGAGDRGVNEEIIAIAEAGLTLPLTLVVFVALVSGEPRLRAFVRAMATRTACTLDGVVSGVPSRAPPLAA